MPRSSPYVENSEKGLVYMFQFPRTSATPSNSPFCLKLETWLRIANIPYKNVEDLSLMTRSKEGTLPFVELDGREYDDSAIIIRDLSEHFQSHTEAHLNETEKASALAMEKLIEYELLPISAKSKIPHIDEVIALMPDPGLMRYIIYPYFRRYFKQKINGVLMATGIGKHSEEEQTAMVQADLLALSRFLGTKPYMKGTAATKLDATAFAVLALIMYMPFETPERSFIEERCLNLKQYCDRVKEKYWPDWEEITKNHAMNTEWNSNFQGKS